MWMLINLRQFRKIGVNNWKQAPGRKTIRLAGFAQVILLISFAMKWEARNFIAFSVITCFPFSQIKLHSRERVLYMNVYSTLTIILKMDTAWGSYLQKWMLSNMYPLEVV